MKSSPPGGPYGSGGGSGGDECRRPRDERCCWLLDMVVVECWQRAGTRDGDLAKTRVLAVWRWRSLNLQIRR